MCAINLVSYHLNTTYSTVYFIHTGSVLCNRVKYAFILIYVVVATSCHSVRGDRCHFKVNMASPVKMFPTAMDY